MAEAAQIEPRRGVYDTRRASALSGVPYRTLHYWASERIYLPSINPEPRTRLWSWGDLLAVRAIYWFRQGVDPKDIEQRTKPAPMSKIREVLAAIEQAGESRENLNRLVAVAEGGELFLRLGEDHYVRADLSGQAVLPDVLNLIQPFMGAPDLLKPRELIRIVPGKLHGEPHVVNTRISTAVLFRLSEMGYRETDIRELYPDVSTKALRQALDLERSLHRAA